MKKFVIFALIAIAMLCMFVGCDDAKVSVTFVDESGNIDPKTVSFGTSLEDIVAMVGTYANQDQVQAVSAFVAQKLGDVSVPEFDVSQAFSFISNSFSGTATINVIDQCLSVGVNVSLYAGVQITVNYNLSGILAAMPSQN